MLSLKKVEIHQENTIFLKAMFWVPVK